MGNEVETKIKGVGESIDKLKDGLSQSLEHLFNAVPKDTVTKVELNNLQNQVQGLVGRLAKVEGSFSGIQGTVTDLRKTLNAQATDLASFKDTINKYVGDLETELKNYQDAQCAAGKSLEQAGKSLQKQEHPQSK